MTGTGLQERGVLLPDEEGAGNGNGASGINYTCMQDYAQPATVTTSAVRKDKKGVCSEQVIVHPTLTLVQLIFSGYHVLTSWALKAKGVDPFVFALYREISASILIALLALVVVRRSGSRHSMMIAAKDTLRFMVMGAFSAINVLGAIYCLSLITPTNFAVMQPSIPVFTMILSVIFRMEKLTFLKALGLSCAVAGAICVELIKPKNGHEKDVSTSDFVVGNLVVVLQCMGMGALLVAQKTVLDRYHPTVVVTWYYSLGSIITLVVCLAKSTPLLSYQLSSDPKPWLALAYAAVFGTVFNYNVYSWAGTVVAPGIIAIYSTIQPIGTAIFSFMVFGNQPTAGEVLCGILVVAGLVLTVTARNVEEKLAAAKRARDADREALSESTASRRGSDEALVPSDEPDGAMEEDIGDPPLE